MLNYQRVILSDSLGTHVPTVLAIASWGMLPLLIHRILSTNRWIEDIYQCLIEHRPIRLAA
jgi:hypothetical protein